MPSNKVKRVKAWIQLYGNVGVRPTIFWTRPTYDEIKIAEEYGATQFPCEIIYYPSQKIKSKKK